MTAEQRPQPPSSVSFPLPRYLAAELQAAAAAAATTNTTAAPDTSASASDVRPAPILVAQGAEARVYRTTYLTPDRPCALKYRPPKKYRHPVLDARLTRQRILAEARILHRCRREGVPVPALYAVDIEDDSGVSGGGSGGSGGSGGGSILTEWVEGGPVRARLSTWLAARPQEDVAALRAHPELIALLHRMGDAVGRLHKAGVVHGDLTTSNLMLRPVTAADNADRAGSADRSDGADGADGTAHHTTDDTAPASTLDGDVVIIDFGLASQSTADEDRAVDLYVLERAFGSTHPRAEEIYPEVLTGYRRAFPKAGPVVKKLEDVRMRGRKRSMLG